MRNRILALAAVLLVALAVAWAGHGKGDAAAQATELQSKLGLTDAQTQQVQALLQDTDRRWDELKATGGDEAAMAEGKKKLKTDYMARMKSILTAEQFARYEELKAAEHSKKHEHK